MWLLPILACSGDPTDGERPSAHTSDTGTTPSETGGPTGAHSGGPSDHTGAPRHSGTHDTGTGTPGTADTGTPPPPPPPDYLAAGPHAPVGATVTSRATSCRGGSTVERFDPDGVPSSAVVVLGHGFSGDRSSMVGWGEHWASWGVTVLVPDLCHSMPWNVDHEENGRDMVALAADLAPGATPLYVGYSAGGLSALVAAASDAGAAGDLGLDAVDAFSIAQGYVGSLPSTSADLHGEPSSCNSQENMVPLYDGASLPTLRVVGADHCDWMWPPDAGCSLVCATGPNDPSIRETIRTLATSWVLWRSGADPGAAAWWTPGDPSYDGLVATGAVAP